jgi:heme/copper-type cytochrome/quinol oxidase subunit 3
MAATSHAEATTTGLNHRKILIWAFLASECMFFATLISTYMVYRHQSFTPPYPEDIFSIPVTSISTFVLLTSSLAMVLALAALQRGDIKRAKLWILATAGFGTTFLMFQVYEFNQFFHEGLSPKTSIFGSTFFTLTGTHGAHVTIGVTWLISLFFAAVKGKLKQENSLNLEIAGLYWHFVDIVWIVIFTLVYLIGGNDSGPRP